MNKNLIVCPTCAMKGRKEVLGAIDPLGFITVMRFHQGYTKIVSPMYQVVCGRCDTVVYSGTASISVREEVTSYGTFSVY